MADKDDEWMTISDIYERLNKKVPMDSIRQWIRTGRLRSFKPGKNYLIRRQDFDEFMKQSDTKREDV